MSVTATRYRFFELARAEINLGSWYNPWFPEKDWGSTMYTSEDYPWTCPSWIPDHLNGNDAGANCASFFNWIRCKMGLNPIGGCGDYNGSAPWFL